MSGGAGGVGWRGISWSVSSARGSGQLLFIKWSLNACALFACNLSQSSPPPPTPPPSLAPWCHHTRTNAMGRRIPLAVPSSGSLRHSVAAGNVPLDDGLGVLLASRVSRQP